MTSEPQKPRRFPLSVAEMLVVVAILSTLWAFLLPAVNAARDAKQRPLVLPELRRLYEPNPWPFLLGTPIVITSCIAIVLGIVRHVLPPTVRQYFPWTTPKRAPVSPPEPIDDSRPALITSALSCTATAMLVLVAWHVRVDRTNRRPIVTWEGPLAECVQYAAIGGWVLSAAAIILGAYTLCRFRSKLNPLAAVAMAIASLNFFGSCLFSAAIYED